LRRRSSASGTYTTPADITQWNFASDDWCCPSAEADLKVGGSYKARMEAKDGSFGFDFEAVYEKVEPDQAITLAMGDGRKARTTFDATKNGTKVTTMFDAETQNSRSAIVNHAHRALIRPLTIPLAGRGVLEFV
jgi:uncharacterized protein YndB with AHSA1/START domain